MTIEYREIPLRTKVLILLLSLLINTLFILFILYSQREHFFTLPAQVIKLDEEELITPSQLMQPMAAPTAQAPSANSLAQPATVPQQPQQTPQPLPQQQDFEWVSGAAGNGIAGTPEKVKTPEIPQPTPIDDDEPEQDEADDVDLGNETEETRTQNDSSSQMPARNLTSIPAGSAFLEEEPAIMQKKDARISDKPQHKASKPTRQLPSLAELTKNFIDRSATDDQQGNPGGTGLHTMGVSGGKQGKVSEKQLTYERYLRKLLICLSTSSKIHKRSIPRTPQKAQARVQFVLNRDGTYYTLGMAQSSGNPAIDDLILTIFKDASSSFPPVPQSLTVPFIAPMFVLNSISDLLMPENWSVSIGQ